MKTKLPFSEVEEGCLSCKIEGTDPSHNPKNYETC